ncbi:MAG TPA: tRNA lysidine(34) synthetase TilS [Verrucomicrobiae bacterium]|nr:tRNA lysidine(34) synthetase TilS [Verrucomicrobiae bacterium]
MKNLLEHVEQSIRGRKLLRSGDRILVAVSGGLDSMVLLHLLHDLAPRFDWKLCVAHFNHQLRGRASDADERLVKNTAAKLSLLIRVGRGDVTGHAKQKGVSLEMAARELRHRFLAKTAQRLKCAAVAFAHHADDQVELFILRLLRGAGGEGLAGMRWQFVSPADKQLRTVRPLLDVTKETLRQFAAARNIQYREDASNASVDILRNRVRNELLPLLRQRFQPGIDRAIRRAAETLRADSEIADEAARVWLKLKPAKRRFAEQPVGLQRRALQLQLRDLGIRPDFDLIELIRRSVGQPVTVSPGLHVQRDDSGRVFRMSVPPNVFRRGRATVSLKGQSGVLQFNGAEISWHKTQVRGAVLGRAAPNREIFDADKAGEHIVLRHWQAGDRFRPIGMRTAVKLQDWFTNRKIPPEQRRKLIVASARGEIFWVEGERIGEKFKLTEETRRRLIWSWKRAETT